MKPWKPTLIAVSLLLLAGFLSPLPARAVVRVAVSIPPQKYFVEKVGGDRVEVTVMVPPGADAHTYEPKPKQMAALAKADIYFTLGLEFEETWTKRFQSANQDLFFVDTAEKIERIPMASSPDPEEQEKSGKERSPDSHDRPDPHIWLSPRLVVKQAEAIRDGLVQKDPDNKQVYDWNLALFKEDIRKLDEDLTNSFQTLAPDKRRVLVFHPAWGYLCREYGLVQVPVEREGKEPTAKGLKLLIEQAKKNGAKVIFVQPQYSDKSAQALAQAIGGRVVKLDPLAADWETNLREAAQQMGEAIF